MKRKNLSAVYLTALKEQLSTMLPYVYFSVIALASTIYTVYVNLYNGAPTLEYTMRYMALPIMLAAPLLTVGTFSGKRERDAMLLSFGLRHTDMLFGRLLAALTVCLSPLLIFTILPPVLSLFGTVDMLGSYLSLLFTALFCAAYLSSLVFVSVAVRSVKLCTAISYTVFLLSYLGNTVCSAIPKSSFAMLCAWLPVSVILSVIIFALCGRVGHAVLTFSAVTVIFSLLCTFFPTAAYGTVRCAYAFLSAPNSLGALLYGGTIDLLAVIRLVLHTAFFSFTALLFLESRRADKNI